MRNHGHPTQWRLIASIPAMLLASLVVAAPVGASPSSTGATGAAGNTYHPITPLRVLDSRTESNVTFPNGVPTAFEVAGVGTIPVDAVAITGNLTVLFWVDGYVSVGPTVSSNPTTSTINVTSKSERANNLTLPLNPDGDLMAVFKSKQSVDRTAGLILDVTGYFLADDSGATYRPITSARILDSRDGTGLSGKFVANIPRTFQVTGAGGVPIAATAVTGNLTVVRPTRSGYVSLTPSPDATPDTSTINFPLGDTIANGVTVPLSSEGKLSVVYKAPSGTTNLVFDVTGYYMNNLTGLRFYPISPSRIMDTRFAVPSQLVGPFKSSVPRTLITGGQAGIPADALAVTGNLTVVGQTSAGYVSITKLPTSTPEVSTINFPRSDVRANGVTVPLNSTNDMALVFKGTGGSTTQLILDVSGYFK